MSLVSLAELKQHLRYDSDDTSNDMVLQDYIEGATSVVMRYINTEITADDEASVRRAIILLCGYYDNNRNIEDATQNDGNYLPAPVRAQIYDLRRPTAL